MSAESKSTSSGIKSLARGESPVRIFTERESFRTRSSSPVTRRASISREESQANSSAKYSSPSRGTSVPREESSSFRTRSPPSRRVLPPTEEKKTSELIASEYGPLSIGEFLASPDLISFVNTIRNLSPNTKLISMNIKLELPLKISRPELTRLAKNPEIENLIVTLAEDEGKGLTDRLWPTLGNFTRLKSLTLKNGAENYLDVDLSFLLTMPHLEELTLENIDIINSEILLQLISLKKLIFVDEDINNFLIPDVISDMRQLTKISFRQQNRTTDFTDTEIKIRNTDSLAKILEKLTNLTSLTVDMIYFGNTPQMMLLSQHRKLEELNIRSKVLEEEDLEHIAQLTNLTNLSLVNCPNISNIKVLETLTNLTDLNLSSTQKPLPDRLNDNCLDTLVKFTNLRKLNIDQAHITTIAPLSKLQYLSSLSMYDCRAITNNEMKQISKFKFLTYLNLGETDITTNIIEYLSQLEFMSELYMSPSDIFDIRGDSNFIQYLGMMSNLTLLSLSALDLTDSEIKVISTLDNLVFFDNSSTPAQVNCFGDIGLVNLGNLPKLTSLYLFGNRNITSAGVRNFLS
jgi:hypothetical protein